MTAQPDETNYIPIKQIVVGERRREDYGDMEALKESINRYGLLHPVIVDSEKKLVAGGRRLRACAELGWAGIPSRDWGALDEDERREIELEENLQRKDLTSYEKARELVRKAPAIAADLARKIPAKTQRGEPRQMAAPKEAVAQALGVDRKELFNATQHVETADAFPFMQDTSWSQNDVLEARKHIAKLDTTEQAIISEIVIEHRADKEKALPIIRNLAEMEKPEREEIVRLHRSDDMRERSLAVTKVAATAPMPDPRSNRLYACVLELEWCVRKFKADPLTPRYEQLLCAVKALREATRERHQELLNGSTEAEQRTAGADPRDSGAALGEGV